MAMAAQLSVVAAAEGSHPPWSPVIGCGCIWEWDGDGPGEVNVQAQVCKPCVGITSHHSLGSRTTQEITWSATSELF